MIDVVVFGADGNLRDQTVECLHRVFPFERRTWFVDSGLLADLAEAVDEGKNELILILEAGMEVGEDFEQKILHRLDRDESIGAAGCMIRSGLTGEIISAGSKTPFQIPPWRGWKDNLRETSEWSQERTDLHLDGRCMALRRSAWEKTGGLRIQAGGHWSIDLSFRIAKEGLKVIFVPCEARHLGPVPTQADLEKLHGPGWDWYLARCLKDGVSGQEAKRKEKR